MNKAILLVFLWLVVSAAREYRLSRMGSKEMCLSGINRLVLEMMLDTCADQNCLINGKEYTARTCGATVESFNTSLIQFGSGRNFSVGWYFNDNNCADVGAIEAQVTDSCEGAATYTCQNGKAKTCLYIQPPVPPVVVQPPPVHPLPSSTPKAEPPSEPVASPVDAPIIWLHPPKAVARESVATSLEKFLVFLSTSGWGVALLFIALYIYLRQQKKTNGYIPLIEGPDVEQPPPQQPPATAPTQPTVITADNKNVLKPILQDTKSRIPNIPASELIIDKTKKLGEGQACQVYEGLWRQKKVAIKIPRDRDATKLMKELIVRSEIDPHPNIVEVFGYFEFEDRICLVLELCNCPNLENMAQQDLSLSDKFAIAMGIASGILHLHHSKRQVIHRDLKPSNILVAKSGSHLIPKIADFDYSRLLSSPKGVTMSTPTTSYAAPEQLAASANAKKEYNVKSDAWAYGAILFYLLTGQTPFAVQNTNALKTQRLNKQALVRFELLDTLPVDPFTSLLVDITRKCLNDDPNKRPMFDRIDNDFADFFNKFYPRGQNRESNNNNSNLQ